MRLTALLIGLLLAAAAFAEFPTALDPAQFLPAGAGEARPAGWSESFREELLRLHANDLISPAALKSTSDFLRTAVYPADPVAAARLVRLTLRETDELLRRGRSAAEIKTIRSAGWRRGLEAARAGESAAKELDTELTVAGDSGDSLPKDKDKKDKKISDKIKDKKEK